jgi:hypothetical protein
MTKAYWVDLFTLETWEEFRRHGADVSGFSEARWPWVKRIRPGDCLLCYLTGESRWVGVLEAASKPFRDESERIWAKAPYPVRIKVKPIVLMKPEHGVPVLDMRNQLKYFQNLKNPNSWAGTFRASPSRWNAEDGPVVVQRLLDAQENPTVRPLKRRNKAFPVAAVTDEKAGALTLPGDDDQSTADPGPTADSESAHTEVQYLLLKLGTDMGFDVHVAVNDQSRQWKGHRFSDMPGRRLALPQQFDAYTNGIIQRIDVLWLKGPAIVAAFEIESTTSIYSGLLRMSDLLAMQPNISIPLFLVAPEDRRSKVINEINRPTFKRREKPLVDVCKYISFEGLREELHRVGDNVSFLRPEWLQKVSEPCDPAEAYLLS